MGLEAEGVRSRPRRWKTAGPKAVFYAAFAAGAAGFAFYVLWGRAEAPADESSALR